MSLICLLIILPTDFLLWLSNVYVGGFSPGNFSLKFFSCYQSCFSLVVYLVLSFSFLDLNKFVIEEM